MTEIDAEKLIRVIKARPALYNKDDNMYYSHRRIKDKLWKEVCGEMYEEWGEMRPNQRCERVRELQKRWKSLRTCFTRELCSQRREKLQQETSGCPAKKRKVYEYFDMMSFLINHNVGTESDNNESTDALDIDFKNDEIINQYKTDTEEKEPRSTESIAERNSYKLLYNYDRNESVEEKMLDLLKEMKKDEGDEDRQFMLSLIPSFKKFNHEQKLKAKIEILEVLKNITLQETSGT